MSFGIVLLIFTIFWSIVGIIIFCKLLDKPAFVKLNDKAVFLLVLVSGPLAIGLYILGYAVEKFERWTASPGFQKKFFRPEHIVHEPRQVDRNIIVVDSD